MTAANRTRWTTADIALFPDDGKRYEIIDGDLIVTRAPHWNHQQIAGRIFSALDSWSQSTGFGEAAFTPGIVFTDADNVIPDVVWVSHNALDQLLNDAGHLTGAPELVVEVLSSVGENRRRDYQLKLKLYSQQGAQEYWIVDPERQQVQAYRREEAVLALSATLHETDSLTSPLLPGFACPLAAVFAQRC